MGKETKLSSLQTHRTFSGHSSTSIESYEILRKTRLRFSDYVLLDSHVTEQRFLLLTLWEKEAQLRREGKLKSCNDVVYLPLKFKSKEKIPLKVDVNVALKPRKIGSFSTIKRRKLQSNQSYMLHKVHLAVRDNDEKLACELIGRLEGKILSKLYFNQAKFVFLLAMTQNMGNAAVLLMEKGFPPNLNYPISGSVIHTDKLRKPIYPCFFLVAISLGNENIIKHMIKKGADVNYTWFGMTPLHVASYISGKGNALIVRLLLENGADPTKGLHLSLFETLKKFVTKRFSPELPRASSSKLNSDLVKYPGRIIKITQDYSENRYIFPIDFAAASKNLETTSVILETIKNTGLVPISSFCLLVQHDLEITIRLIKAGANIRQTTPTGSNPLHHAARSGKTDLIAVLLHANAPINSLDYNRWTPLHEAAAQGHRNAVRYLLKQGANCTIRNNSGETALQLALKSGFKSEEIIGFFEKVSHDLETEDDKKFDENLRELLGEVARFFEDGKKKGKEK